MALLLAFALTNVKGLFESGKFTLKMTCESGKLVTTGCHLPPKSTKFGILSMKINCLQNTYLKNDHLICCHLPHV